jgi:hypothetical protein
MIVGSVGRPSRREQHQLNDPIGVGVGQRLEQYGVDDAEYGGACADPEGQRQHGNCRKRRGFRENSQTIPNILNEAFDGVDAPHVAAFLFPLLEATDVA